MSTTNRLLVIMNTLLALILVLAIIQFAPTNANAASSSIAACANKKTGQLRLATPACTSSEKKVSWALVGPRGPQGNSGSSASMKTKTISYYSPYPWSCPVFGQPIVTSVDISSYANPLSVTKDYYSGAVTGVRWNTYPSILSKQTSSLECETATVYVP